MDIVFTVLSEDRVLINGDIYKRLKTIGGKYKKEDRSKYMKAWRTKQKFINIIK